MQQEQPQTDALRQYLSDNGVIVRVCNGRQDWLKARKTVLGASDVPVLFAEHFGRSAYSLWVDKVSINDDIDEDEAEELQWGTDLEPLICQRYQKETGRPVWDIGACILSNPETPFLGATLDRLTSYDNLLGVLEAKNRRDSRDWKVEIPESVYQQIQTQLFCSNLLRASAAVLLMGCRWRYADFEPDLELQAEIRRRAADFWQRVQDRVPPPIDGSEATRRAIVQRFPQDNQLATVLPGDLYDAHMRRIELKEKANEIEKELAKAENEIRQGLGDYAYGTIGTVTYSAKTQTRRPTIKLKIDGMLTANEIAKLNPVDAANICIMRARQKLDAAGLKYEVSQPASSRPLRCSGEE